MGDHAFSDNIVELWDWRRRIAELYGRIRVSEPREAWRLWRATRDELFRDHPQSPLEARRKSFSGLSYFDYDPSLRILAGLVPEARRERIKVDLGHDGLISFAPFARTQGLAERFGGELNLYWIEGYGGGVFLPFKDATCGTETYGGGRYLLDTIKGADLGCTNEGQAILDFNFAYHPSCFYSSQWVCPLAPFENVLPGAICGGERTI